MEVLAISGNSSPRRSINIYLGTGLASTELPCCTSIAAQKGQPSREHRPLFTFLRRRKKEEESVWRTSLRNLENGNLKNGGWYLLFRMEEARECECKNLNVHFGHVMDTVRSKTHSEREGHSGDCNPPT